jgi:hypothetical protein
MTILCVVVQEFWSLAKTAKVPEGIEDAVVATPVVVEKVTAGLHVNVNGPDPLAFTVAAPVLLPKQFIA